MKKANWNKQNNTQYRPKEDHISKMSKAMDNLCNMLAEDSEDFDAKKFLNQFGEYITNSSNRLLYTNVTNAIFDNYTMIGTFQTNLEKVITYSYEKELDDNEKIQKALMKLWDHINLAIRQYELFNQSDEHYEIIAEEKMKNVEIRLTKEMNMQLISLVGIFTALSFLIFGGISSLDNIFLGAQNIPVTKLIITGTIWSFCIMNLIYVFMFFIEKLTDLNIKSTKDINANLVQKYPLIWWCNLVLIAILILSCWIYYVKGSGTVSSSYFLLGTLTIIIFIVAVAVKIYKLSKTELKD